MISYLRGKIIDKSNPGTFVIDVNGVGYQVETSLATFFKVEDLEQEVCLFIHMIVREDAHLLFGFYDQEERNLFKNLIKVNGVGPKLAITILSSINPSEFAQAIDQQNSHILSKIPGIGKKTAERLMIEMKGKIEALSFTSLQSTNDNLVPNEAIEALQALGYQYKEASKVINKIFDETKNSAQLIREGLQILSTKV